MLRSSEPKPMKSLKVYEACLCEAARVMGAIVGSRLAVFYDTVEDLGEELIPDANRVISLLVQAKALFEAAGGTHGRSAGAPTRRNTKQIPKRGQEVIFVFVLKVMIVRVAAAANLSTRLAFFKILKIIIFMIIIIAIICPRQVAPRIRFGGKTNETITCQSTNQ